MTITPATHVTDIVTAAPATSAVFQRHGLEFCCGGHIPLAEACARAGLDLDEILAELETALETFTDTRNWQEAPIPDLVAHLRRTYHDPLRVELPRLAAMCDRVVERHGASLPALGAMRYVFVRLLADLEAHLEREHNELFPAIERLAAHADPVVDDGHPLAEAVADMDRDHAATTHAFARLRQITCSYEPPEWACPTFRGLYQGLSQLEHRMRLHLHLENDVLFPRALALGHADRTGDQASHREC